MDRLLTLRRYWHTVRCLSAGQVAHRLRLTLQRQGYRLAGDLVTRRLTARAARAGVRLQTAALLPGADRLAALPLPPDAAAALARAAAVRAGRFAFLGVERRQNGRTFWRCPDASRLWRYHLHYFDYALDLGIAYRLTGEAANYESFRALVDSWLAHNPVGAPDAWHPYPLSLRVVNWLYAARLFAPALEADPGFARRLAHSLGAQVRFLGRNLELDVLGNHLVKNALALVVAGTGLADPEAAGWLQRGRGLLEQEAAVQALPDGGHYERSPMYHSQVLFDLLQATVALRGAGVAVPAALTAACRRMLAFLAATVHLDGEIPLLNDAALGMALPPAALLTVGGAVLDGSPGADSLWLRLLGGVPAARADDPDRGAGIPAEAPGPGAGGGTPVKTASPGPESGAPAAAKARGQAATGKGASRPLLTAFPETGYWIFRPPGEYLIADCGPPCPAFLPAHAHCDLLSFEYGAAGRRILVDAGTYAYGAGPWRQYFRSTAAHNTLVIDGREQHDAWGAFRLGERSTVLGTASGETAGCAWFTGAYRLPRGGPVHRRLIAWLAGAGWLIADLVTAPGPIRAEAWYHPHPDVAVTLPVAPGAPAQLSVGELTRRLLPAGGLRWELRPGGDQSAAGHWYSERFGERRPAPALRLHASGAQCLRLACALLTAPGPATLLWQDDLIQLTLAGRPHRLRWQGEAVRLT